MHNALLVFYSSQEASPPLIMVFGLWESSSAQISYWTQCLESTFMCQGPTRTHQCCVRKPWEVVRGVHRMLTWRCSTQARSSGWLDPLRIHTATPDVSWLCPLSQTLSPSQSLHLRLWCYRQFAWWISCEQKQVSINQVLPAAKQKVPKRAQLLTLHPVILTCVLGGDTHCHRNRLWIVWHVYQRKWHCLFAGLNKTTRGNIFQVSEWKLNPKGSPNQTSIQKYFCVIKYLMDVSFLPADICSSSS